MRILGHEGERRCYWGALRALSEHLHRHHGEKAVILLDEYDSPIHAGFSAGYYDAIVVFFRNFLSGGLKDNPHLWKGPWLTGILRVAKESIFSGLNNLSVYSSWSPFAASFGFTPARWSASRARSAERPRSRRSRLVQRVPFRRSRSIYNPWSVLNFLASQRPAPRPYWLSTSSLDLVPRPAPLAGRRRGGRHRGADPRQSITKLIDENVLAPRPPTRRQIPVWASLLFTGYLTATRARDRDELVEARPEIPNREVRAAFRTVFRTWLRRAIGDGDQVQALARALLGGDAETAERLLQNLVLASLSFHDTGKGPGEPERVYHAFMLGLLVWLGPRYRVSSNREAGYGRCGRDDRAQDRRAAGGGDEELKTVDKARRETPAKAMAAALRQLRARDYAAGNCGGRGGAGEGDWGGVRRQAVKVAVAKG